MAHWGVQLLAQSMGGNARQVNDHNRSSASLFGSRTGFYSGWKRTYDGRHLPRYIGFSSEPRCRPPVLPGPAVDARADPQRCSQKLAGPGTIVMSVVFGTHGHCRLAQCSARELRLETGRRAAVPLRTKPGHENLCPTCPRILGTIAESSPCCSCDVVVHVHAVLLKLNSRALLQLIGAHRLWCICCCPFPQARCCEMW